MKPRPFQCSLSIMPPSPGSVKWPFITAALLWISGVKFSVLNTYESPWKIDGLEANTAEDDQCGNNSTGVKDKIRYSNSDIVRMLWLRVSEAAQSIQQHVLLNMIMYNSLLFSIQRRLSKKKWNTFFCPCKELMTKRTLLPCYKHN